MSRLPKPGADDGTWGDILNDFLGVEHNDDGTQKTLDISKGGTSATTASGALTNLGGVSTSDSRLSDNRTPTDGSVTDAKVANGANIAKSKLAALNIVDADVSNGASIAKSKLAALNISDADVASNAAIAKSKLAALNIGDSDVTAISESKITNLTGDLANKSTNPNLALDRIQYVSVNGDDSNDGLSWGTAKLTPDGAITALVDGSRGKGIVYLGVGRFDRTTTLEIPATLSLIGMGARPAASNQSGTEIAWVGADSTDSNNPVTVIKTLREVDVATSDWSQGLLKGFRVTNQNGAPLTFGIGVDVRNAQNGAMLDDIQTGNTNADPNTFFPTKGIWVHDDHTPSSGGYPGFFKMHHVFVHGGAIPIHLMAGVTQLYLDFCGVDTDTLSTCAIQLDVNPQGGDRGADITFNAVKVEMHSGDIDGFVFNADSNITLIGCSIRRPGNIGVSTKTAYLYNATPTNPGLPALKMIGCASFNMANWFSAPNVAPSGGAVYKSTPDSQGSVFLGSMIPQFTGPMTLRGRNTANIPLTIRQTTSGQSRDLLANADSTGSTLISGFGPSGMVRSTAGATGSRPTPISNKEIGAEYFDTTLGRPVWWNGTTYVDPITAGSTSQAMLVATDQTATNNSTLANVPGMSFGIGVSETHQFDMELFYTASATGDMKVDITIPSGATIEWSMLGLPTNATTNNGTLVTFEERTTGNTAVVGAVDSSTKCVMRIKGIVINGSTSGNVQLRFAQSVSDGTATTIYTNSFGRAQRVA